MEENNIQTTTEETVQETGLTLTGEATLEARPIETITAEIWLLKQQAGAAILEIGRRLIEAKAALPHGEWETWLAEKVEFSDATARRFMRLAKEYGNQSTVTVLGASKALVLLALPASERDEFMAEKHLVNGQEKTVEEMSKRELETAIRERDEARKQVAALRDDLQTQLEEQRAVYDTDTADLRGKIEEAENRAAGYEQKLKAAKEKAAQDAAAAEADLAALRDQLEDLKAAPKEVAVEKVVDQDAVKAAADAAKREAEDRLKKKIERAEKAKDAAEKAKAKAEQDLAALKVAQEEQAAIVAKEKEAMAEQVAALQKKLAVASSSEVAIFKLHFGQAQESINKMTECIQRMTEGGAAEDAGKLTKALSALLTATMDVLK